MTRNMLAYLMGMKDLCQGEFEFSNLQLLSKEELSPDTLYLALEQESRDDPQVLALSSLDEINQALCFHQKYLRWRENCLRLASVEHDLATYLEHCGKFMNWDIWVVTPDYQFDVGYVNHFTEHIQFKDWIPRSEVEDLYANNPKFDDTFCQRGIMPYPQYVIPGAVLYYYNLFQENLYLGRLLIHVSQDRVDGGMMEILKLVCEDVEECYRYLFLRKKENDPGYRFYHLWKGLLEDRPIDRDQALEGLGAMNWCWDDTYEVIYLSPMGYADSPHTLKYYAVQIENILSDLIAVQMEEGIYCLHNLTRDRNEDFRQKLGEFLRENLFRAGISNSFRDYFDSKRYRDQAEAAMVCGQAKDPSLWRYAFCDYVSRYTLDKCLQDYPARDLCPRNLRILLDYEAQQPGGDLVQTLYQYYACQFNAQLAAQKLFIHRTTFFYRLNKIQKIAQFHPEDPEETTQVMLAFQALRHIGAEIT